MSNQAAVRDNTTRALLNFYRQLTRLSPYDRSVLQEPPADGWDSLKTEELKGQGKDESVIQVLQHLPYFRSGDQRRRLLIAYETVPIDYTSSAGWMEGVYPLPGNCIYLTEGVDREGYSLILDASQGTITAYSISGYDITLPYEEFDAMPEADKWRAHRTTPITEFFQSWIQRYANLVWMLSPSPRGRPTAERFYSRAQRSGEDDELAKRGLVEWRPEEDSQPPRDINEEQRRAERKHVAVSSPKYQSLCLPSSLIPGRRISTITICNTDGRQISPKKPVGTTCWSWKSAKTPGTNAEWTQLAFNAENRAI